MIPGASEYAMPPYLLCPAPPIDEQHHQAADEHQRAQPDEDPCHHRNVLTEATTVLQQTDVSFDPEAPSLSEMIVRSPETGLCSLSRSRARTASPETAKHRATPAAIIAMITTTSALLSMAWLPAHPG